MEMLWSMSSAVKKSSITQWVVLFEVFLGFFATLFFLLFGSNFSNAPYPTWYSLGTTILELFAFFLATALCLRNALSSTIVSSRRVWWGIAIGMLLYFIGNIFFTYWELGLQREPDVSPGDLFYMLSYLFLMVSMGFAVFERRLNLDGKQYGIIGAVGLIGVLVAVALASGAAPEPAAADAAETAAVVANVPGWVVGIEDALLPYKTLLSFLYLIADTVLLIIATTLFLAFSGGRFAQSWRVIAAGTFCLYIADAWFKFATTKLPNYQSGGFFEVGWVLCAVLFGLGAALEYSASQQRRSSSRRRG
jgi:hypothetical protein